VERYAPIDEGLGVCDLSPRGWNSDCKITKDAKVVADINPAVRFILG